MHCLSPEISTEIDANNEYQYEDNDIIRILGLKLNELKKNGLQLDVHQLAPISDHALEQFISDVKNFINQKKQFIQQLDTKTYLVIPYNLGIYHWTGLLIILDANFEAKKIIYCDSLNGSANIPQDLHKRLIQLWPKLSVSAIETRTFYLQSDNTSCGVLAIENLIGLLRVVGVQQIFSESKQLLREDTQEIRKEHLKLIELKTRDKYEYFYRYQRDNRPTVLSLHEQLAFHTKGVKFSPQEYLRIHKLCKIFKEFSNPLLKEAFLHSLNYEGNQNIEVKEYLVKIRSALRVLWEQKIPLNTQDRDSLFQIIKMMIRIEVDQSNFGLDLIDKSDFWISHEELKKCYDLLNNNSNMITVENLIKNIHLIETQIINKDYCLFPEVFEAMATRHKDKIAIIDENSNKNGKAKITYEELSNRVNQLANYLKNQLLVPVQKNYDKCDNDLTYNEASSLREDEIPIGVFLPASAEAVIAILAIWKAGLVYVPLGVRNDRFGRTVRAIKQSKPKLIISNQSYIDVFKTSVSEYNKKDKSLEAELNAKLLNDLFLFDISSISKLDEHDKSHEIQSVLLSYNNPINLNRAAYIFPSSGSTGNPKDIIIEHRGLYYPMYSISHMHYKNGAMDLAMTNNDVVGQFAELTFDASILEIMMTLGMGATLVIIPEDIRTDAKKLSNFFNSHKINICTFTPTMLTNLEPSDYPKFKFIISTGEKLPKTVLDKWTKAGIPIINGYGPSEVSIASSLGLCTTDDIHIGQPIANLQIHVLGKKCALNDKNRIQDKDILDNNDKQILVENKLLNNEEGELYIQSPGLARGYLNNPDLTKKRFMLLALDGPGKPPVRVYRTRDAGKYNNGNYYTTGRLDRQIKIYGQLLNPEDIDEIINKDAKNIKVAHTCVEFNKDDLGQEHPIITAYILLKPGSKLQNQIADKQRAILGTNTKIEMFAELKRCFIKARKRLSNPLCGLPYYQIPSRWCIISELASNPNQKIETSKLNEKAITKPGLLHADGDPIIVSANILADSIEIKLANKWREIINLDKDEPIYPEDNFLWLGGTSINYLQLQRWIETEYPGIHLPSFLAYYEKGTFQQMVMWIYLHTTKIDLIKPLRNLKPNKVEENKFPLILIHALWGNAEKDYSAFEAPPHQGRDIYLISAPGLENPHLICRDVNTLAGCYARAIRTMFGDSGYIIAGWSTGGAIANAVTNILHKDGHRVAGIMLDTLLPKSQSAKDQCEAIIEHFKETAKDLEWNKNPAINLDKDTEFKKTFEMNNNPLKLIDELFKLLQAKRVSELVDKKAPEIKTVHSLMIALHCYKPVKNSGLVCLLKTEDRCLKFAKDSDLGWKAVNQISSLLPGAHHGIKNANSQEWFKVLLETTNELEAEISLRDIQSQLKKAYLSRYKNHQYDYRLQITGGATTNSFQDLFKGNKNDVVNTFILSAESGMGKTATLKAISHLWAEGKLPFFKIVIYVDINNFIKKENVTVEDFIIEQLQSDSKIDPEKKLIVKYFRNITRENILLLVDNYQSLINTSLDNSKKLKKLIKECLGKNYDILFCITPDVESKVLRKIKKSNQRKSNTKLLFLTPLQDKHIEKAIKNREEFTILNAPNFIEYLSSNPDVKEKTRNPKLFKDSINRYLEEHDEKLLLSDIKSETSASHSKSVQSSSDTKLISSSELKLSSIYSNDEFTTIKNYVKREALTRMMGLIQPSSLTSQPPLIQVCFITGITGAGKSELARAYGVYYKEQCLKLHQRYCIFWLNAEKPQEWISSINKFSSKTGCQISQSSQDLSVLIMDFVKALQHYPEFLLVIDNLEDSTHKYLMQFLQELNDYLDKKLIIKGTILVTTQKHTISNISWPVSKVHSITLNSGMTREEAVCLMSQFLKLDEVQLEANKDHIEHFLDELGFLPLTISTAAACLLQAVTSESDLKNKFKSYLDDYLSELKAFKQETVSLLEESWSIVSEIISHKHKTNQIRALLLSIGNLKSSHVKAFELLALLSFLESRTLTHSTIEIYAPIILQIKTKLMLNSAIGNALQQAMNFSLITQTSEDKKFNYHLHPQAMMICRYVCEHQYADEEKKVFYQKLKEILNNLLERIKEENISSNKEDKLSIENSLEYLDHASYLNEHLLRLKQITEIEYKNRKDKLLKAEKILSNRVYYEAGDEEEAIKRYNHILSINPEDIDTLQDRANCYRFLQKYNLAFQDLKELKRLAKDNLGIKYQYIRVLEASGAREEAERKFKKIQKQDTGKEYIRERLSAYEALGRREELLSMIESYDDTLQTKCIETKILCLDNMRRYDEAIKLCRNAINEKLEITPYIFYRLALELQNKGDYAEAVQAYKTAILKHKMGTRLWLLMVDALSDIDEKYYNCNISTPQDWITFVDYRVTEHQYPAFYWLLYVSYYCGITKNLLQKKDKVDKYNYKNIISGLIKLNRFKDFLKNVNPISVIDSIRYVIAVDLDNKNYKRAYRIAELVYEIELSSKIIDLIARATSGIKNYSLALEYYLQWLKLDKENFFKNFYYIEFVQALIFYYDNEKALMKRLARENPIAQLYFLVSAAFIMQKHKSVISPLISAQLIKSLKEHLTKSVMETLRSGLVGIIIFYSYNKYYTEALSLSLLCRKFDLSKELFYVILLCKSKADLNKFNESLEHFIECCKLDKEKFISLLIIVQDSLFNTIQFIKNVEVLLQSISGLKPGEKLCALVAMVHSKTINDSAPEDKLFIALKDNLERYLTDSLFKVLWDKLTPIIDFYLNNGNYIEALSLINICKKFDISAKIYEYLSIAAAGLDHFNDALYYFINWCALDSERFLKECDRQNNLFKTIQFIDDIKILQSISVLNDEEKLCFLVAMIHSKFSNVIIPENKLFIALKDNLDQCITGSLFKLLWCKVEMIIANYVSREMLTEALPLIAICNKHNSSPEINEFLSIEGNDRMGIIIKPPKSENQVKQQLIWRQQLASYHYHQSNLEEAIKSYTDLILLSPQNTNAHHNLACLYHVKNEIDLAEQHFKYALNIKSYSSTHGDYGFFLLCQKQYEKAIKNFVTAISLSSDGGELNYGRLEQNLLDIYLRQEVRAKSDLEIKPFFIAHYWLIQCFHFLQDYELREFYLSRLVNIVRQLPLPLHYRILSYAYLLVGNTEEADKCTFLATLKEEMKIDQEQLANFNCNHNYLNELTQLVEKSPTILRYRVLSYVYLSIDNEKAQEYDAIALSLEPTVEPLAKENISQNTPEVTSGYNPTLFAKSDADTLNIKQLIGNKGITLRLLLQEAKISVISNQNNYLVKIAFTNQKLVQQFTEELQKIGINNQSSEDGSKKSQVSIRKDDEEDECVIVLNADEYNRIMEDKDACKKLTSQVENKNFALPVMSQNDQLNIARSASPKKYLTTPSLFFWQPVKEINREPLLNLEKVKIWLKDILPKDVNLGSAISKGDCFFDAVAQMLNQNENKEIYDVKSLRLLCDEYAKDKKNNWVELANKRDRENHNSNLTRIQFTSEEMEANEKQGLKLGIAVWGRPKIEGRVVCEKFKIKLHVIEIQESGEVNRFLVDDKGENEDVNPVINYNEKNLIHIVNYRNHYVPLIMSKILDKKIGLQK